MLLTLPVWGQSLHGGLKAGVPATAYFETGLSASLHGDAAYSAATRRYTFGATGEWWTTSTVGFEVDGLYHRIGYAGIVHFFSSVSGSFDDTAIHVTGNSWDFPLMAKVRFRRRARPYVAGGGVLRYIGPVRGLGAQTIGSVVTRTSSTTVLDTADPSELRKRFYPGLTAVEGVEFRAGPIRWSPEIRYTRWTANISGPGGLLRFAPNQVELLISILY